jgi:hypothetical protein
MLRFWNQQRQAQSILRQSEPRIRKAIRLSKRRAFQNSANCLMFNSSRITTSGLCVDAKAARRHLMVTMQVVVIRARNRTHRLKSLLRRIPAVPKRMVNTGLTRLPKAKQLIQKIRIRERGPPNVPGRQQRKSGQSCDVQNSQRDDRRRQSA